MTYSIKLTVHNEHIERTESIFRTMKKSVPLSYGVQTECESTCCIMFEAVASLDVLSHEIDMLISNGLSFSCEWKSTIDNAIFGESHYRKSDDINELKEWIGNREKVISIETVRNTLAQEGEVGLMELFEREEDKYEVLDWDQIAI